MSGRPLKLGCSSLSTLDVFKLESDEFFFLKEPDCVNPTALADVGVGGVDDITGDDRGDERERARRVSPRP